MSESPSVQRLIRVPRSPCLSTGSFRSHASSTSSTLSTCYRGQVHLNDAFEKGTENPDDHHEYDSITSVLALGPRRKDNGLYESTTPVPSPTLPQRTRKVKESAFHNSSRSSSSSSDSVRTKGGTNVSNLVFLPVTFVVSVAALALVMLMFTGVYGPKCMCTQDDNVSPPETGMIGEVTLQSLRRRIQDLENITKALQAKLNEGGNEKRVNFLQNEVSAQSRTLNETVRKVNLLNCSSEKTSIAGIKLMNESINALKNSGSELKTAVSKLQYSHVLVRGITTKLTANVTQLQSQLQRLRNSGGNVSRRAETLEAGYAYMTSVIKTLQDVNGVQNTSYEALRDGYKRLANVLATVNATLKKKLDSSEAANFSSCKHKTIEGTPVSTGDSRSAVATASYRELPSRRVTGVTCSTNYAHEFKLQHVKVDGFYKCQCSGLSERANARNPKPKSVTCYLNLWECQINT